MTNWTLHLPVPVEFGAGCVHKPNRYLAGARRALLVTGRHAMKAAGVTDRVCDILAEAGVEVRVFDSITSDPNYDEKREN
ncbi:MAG: iron-containing alcohol dehydrogenase [Chloroflexi bacterium]|nr:iron-containing alcohol dehydrogenase [Chloroflexota bacterium]